jgi:hypothetical protein
LELIHIIHQIYITSTPSKQKLWANVGIAGNKMVDLEVKQPISGELVHEDHHLHVVFLQMQGELCFNLLLAISESGT